jgi:hypothetical protein
VGGSQDSVTKRVEMMTACRLVGGPGTPPPPSCPPPGPPRRERMGRGVVAATPTLPAAARPTTKKGDKNK